VRSSWAEVPDKGAFQPLVLPVVCLLGVISSVPVVVPVTRVAESRCMSSTYDDRPASDDAHDLTTALHDDGDWAADPALVIAV
jgi:hypothetical protein